MRRSEPRMNTAVDFVEHLDGFAAQGQEFFVRPGAWLDLRPMIRLSTTDATRRLTLSDGKLGSVVAIARKAGFAPKPTPMITLANGEVGWGTDVAYKLVAC